VIRSLKNGRTYGLEDICAEKWNRGTISNIETNVSSINHQTMFKRISCIRPMESGMYLLKKKSKKNPNNYFGVKYNKPIIRKNSEWSD